jgi:hypothetical protein
VWDRVKRRGRRSKSVWKVIVWKPEGKWSADRYQLRWEYNIKMDVIQIMRLFGINLLSSVFGQMAECFSGREIFLLLLNYSSF